MAKKDNASFWGKIGKFFKRLWFKISGFFVRTYQELRRMRWPGKKVLIGSTCIVLSFIFLSSVYIIFGDLIIAQIFRLIY